MSNKAMSWATECNVTRSHKLILMLLADAHNGHTGECFPSQETLGVKSGYGESTVQACLKDLEDWGLIKRETSRLGRGKGSRTNYVLHTQILDPRILEVQNSGNRPPENTPLDPQPAGGLYKEEPEYNRKEPETAQARDAVQDAVETIWKAAPLTARGRSGKKPLAAQLRAILKDRKELSAAQLCDAWLEFLRTPDARKDDGRFVPGMHVWFKGGRFEAFLKAPAQTDDPAADDGPPLALIRCFYQYGTGGAWTGRSHGWPISPDAAEAAGLYPDELYAQYGVPRPGQSDADTGKAA